MAKILSLLDQSFLSKDLVREGNWYGNDTIWRTIIDINKIIKYSDENGVMKDAEQRKIFTIADMIVIGEKEGPLLPSPKYAGIIAASKDLVCFDETIATILGFDVTKIPLYKNVRNISTYPLVEKNNQPIIVSNLKEWNNITIDKLNKSNTLNIEPSFGWKGKIELE